MMKTLSGMALAAVAAFSNLVAADLSLTNLDFEDIADGKAAGWSLSGQFRAERGAGHNGNGGIVFESAEPSAKLSSAVQDIVGLEHGDTIQFTAQVRKEGYSHKGYGAQVTIEQRDAQGQWIGALYAGTQEKAADGDWYVVKGSGLVPANAASARLAIHVAENSQGKVSFDNIVVERKAAKPVQFVTSNAYRDTAAGGKVRFHASLETPDDKVGKVRARFAWKNAAGEVVRADATKLTADEAMIELDVGDFAMGRQQVACGLFEGDKKLDIAAVAFTRVAELPVRRVTLDRKGRCLVDGRPFFPIGIYAYPSREALDKVAQSPFNTIIHYKQLTAKELDEFSARGLKTFSAYDRKLPPEEMKARIAAVKDHPALLAWYIGDELSVSAIPDQVKLYEMTVEADPNHPVYSVQDRTYDLRPFIRTADIIGLDPYPVAQRPVRMVTDFMRAGRAACFDVRVQWSVPQMFNWGLHRPTEKDREHFPTEAELRSMAWQHIAAGANGLVAYKMHGGAPDPVAEWELDKKVYGEIAAATEYLMSDEPVPELKVSSDDITCRAWVKDGKLSLVACNLLNEPQKGTVRVGAPFDCEIALDLKPIDVFFKGFGK